MKTWVFVFLCFATVRAFASSADSGRCPWKMPFTISVSAQGTDHRYEIRRVLVTGGYYDDNSDYGVTKSSEGFAITFDTSNVSTHYSLRNDVLTFTWDTTSDAFTPYQHQEVVIVFYPGKDSIVSLSLSGSYFYTLVSPPWPGGPARYLAGTTSLKLNALLFTDSSIFSNDSSFSRHQTVMHGHSADSEYDSWAEYDYNIDDFTANSVMLSGLFPPTTLSDPVLGGTGCPWKVPFTIRAHAAGESYGSGYFVPGSSMGMVGTGLNNDVVPDTEDLSFTVDSTYSLRNDTLRFKGDSTSELASEVVTIIFAHGEDSIISIACSENIDGAGQYFQISALRFDSTGVYTSDASFKDHQTDIHIDRGCLNYIGRHDYVSIGNNFVASSASLSGLLRPIYLENPVLTYNPWHLPFKMNIHGEGVLDSVGIKRTGAEDLALTLWCSAPAGQDTFYFSSGTESCNGSAEDTTVEIDFVRGTDSASRLTLTIDSTVIYAGALQEQWEILKTTSFFQAFNLTSDSAGIFTLDSSFCAHHLSMSVSSTNESYDNSEQTYDTLQTFTATSATLSGIFRPMHYTCEASVAEPIASKNDGLNITYANDGLHCSFDAADYPRNLEVYSLLGSKVASHSIPPGATEATTPHLLPGFYFVRLGEVGCQMRRRRIAASAIGCPQY